MAYWQTSPGGAWNGWVSLGGLISGSPTAAVNADGRLEIFVRNPGNIVYYNCQTSPGGGWSGWIGLGGAAIATPPVVARNFDGRLQIFALGTDGAVWTNYQQIPGVDDWSGWTSLGGYVAGSPSVAQNADGRLEVFVLGGGDGALYHNWQTSPGGAWSGWSVLAGDGNMATPPTVAMNDDGRLEVFDQTTDGAGWHIWQLSPSGSAWSSGATLGGGIVGSPTAALDGGTYLEAFAISPDGTPWVDYQSNGFAGWNALPGIIKTPPAIAMNFDGRLEIFATAPDQAVYHDWQLSPAGPWSGWQLLGAPSNAGTTNGADLPYFLTDAQNEQNYFNALTSCKDPPWNLSQSAWPCDAMVNIGFTGFGFGKKAMKAFTIAKDKWNIELDSYYSPTYGHVPVQLYFSYGGPQKIYVYRVGDNKIPGNKPGSQGRARNFDAIPDSNDRLFRVDIQIIRGMKYPQTLTNTFAHELGHTFGLADCDGCGKTTVMDTNERAPNGPGWDYVGKNFTEGLPGPTPCDLGVVTSHLPDYASCGIPQNAPPPDQPTCTDGTAVAFTDSGGPSSTYTCDGYACDGCNADCSNYSTSVLGTGQCGETGGGSGSCPETASCDDYSPGVSAVDYCRFPSTGCRDGYYASNFCCYNATPIVVDAFGEGFHLTRLSNGVQFRIYPDEPPYQVSWTEPQFRNGWLALDRNGTGKIDDFTELFGNMTPQPKGSGPNGYRALALFDDPMNGGNGNGVIDPGDSVYDNLRVWIDANHNGISEPSELHTLRQLGIFRIALQYTESRYVDANGNQFRYRGRIWDKTGGSHKFCYDVTVAVSAGAAN